MRTSTREPEAGIMCGSMHFQRLSSKVKDVHELAAKSYVEFRWLSPRQKYITTVHMSGDVIGILFTRHSEKVVEKGTDVFILYNWRTSVQHAVS